MSVDLSQYYEANKLLARHPNWIQPDAENLRLTCPLDIDGVTIAGLEFCAYASTHFANEGVRLQLQFQPPKGKSYPFSRLDWKPFHQHSNNGRGPDHLRYLLINGSHLHSFALNFIAETGSLRQSNLPIAEPLVEEPKTFQDLLAFTANMFRIQNLDWVPFPPWQGKII